MPDKSQWRTGTVMDQRGPMSHQVQLWSDMIQHRHVDHLCKWVPACLTNAGPPVVMYQHRHLLCWLKPPVMFLMNNRSRSTPMPNHHMVHRKFCLLIPRRTPSQWRRIVAIPDVTITQLTGIVFLNRAVGLCSCVLYLALSSVRGKECSVCY